MTNWFKFSFGSHPEINTNTTPNPAPTLPNDLVFVSNKKKELEVDEFIVIESVNSKKGSYQSYTVNLNKKTMKNKR